MFNDKKFFIIFSQISLFIFNLFIFIVSICLLNHFNIFSLTNDVVLNLSQKLFIILFCFSSFSLVFLLVPLIFDIASFIHSYRVKKRDLLIKDISLSVQHNLPCYAYSEIEVIKNLKK